MYKPWLDILAVSPLFRGINQDALNVMLECLKPVIKTYRQREIVKLAGQAFNGIGIIAEGGVALTRETSSGNRIIIEILSPGNIFGEVIAFSENKTWPVTVIAQENSILLFLPPEKITGNCANLCGSHSALMNNMLKILSSRALMLTSKIEQLSAGSIRGKISSYLLELYRQNRATAFTIPMKRHELADYLGIPRPSLSREMGHMRDDGIMDFHGCAVNIKKLMILEELSGKKSRIS